MRSGTRRHQAVAPEVAARLARRYPPPRVPRRVLVVVVGLGVLLSLVWLVDTALRLSNPPVAALVSSYRVLSDTEIEVTLTVDRPDPSQRATCRVVAQAEDFVVVAEQRVPIAAAESELVNATFTLTTLRRATTAKPQECTVD